MSELNLIASMGSANGMDAGQNVNFTRVMGAQYDTTDNFKKEITTRKLGRPEMLDYKGGNGFGKKYLMGSYFAEKDTQSNFNTPEKAYLYLDKATKGKDAIFKPNKYQLEKATGVLNSFDTEEKIRQVQATLGVAVTGLVDDDTKRASANYLTVFDEKDFKTKVTGALSAPRNYTTVLEAFRTAETGSNTFAEKALHIGQETLNDFNNKGKGVANTTRYGVVEKNYISSSGTTVQGFAKNTNESDYDHALRFYKARVLPKVEKVTGIQNESQAVVSAVASLAWNRGSLPSNLDLTNEVKSRAALLDVTTTGRKHSTGVANRSIQEYEKIAAEKGWATISSVKTIPDATNSNKFNLEFYGATGELLYKDSTIADTAPKSSIKPNYKYAVSGGQIQTGNGTLLSVS